MGNVCADTDTFPTKLNFAVNFIVHRVTACGKLFPQSIKFSVISPAYRKVSKTCADKCNNNNPFQLFSPYYSSTTDVHVQPKCAYYFTKSNDQRHKSMRMADRGIYVE